MITKLPRPRQVTERTAPYLLAAADQLLQKEEVHARMLDLNEKEDAPTNGTKEDTALRP